ncbi:radical SAM protein [uncultured Pseudodesulfovibrio sp.]|uniref:radical SAM/SPASM domain-containing protein n=1 Tax=uncultured Pseudodesulfovibrio sp. TaxID=2035858 RepID=UPI0029C8CD6E|nr:radical SAM protein [uncultured Pseudodesulfovibrio sp.]
MIEKIEDVTPENLQKELDSIADRLDLESLEDYKRFPQFFQIETVRICNSRCTFCAVNQWDKSVPFMSDYLFDKIAEEMSDYTDWIRFVALQRAGEPLLDKSLFDRIKKLKDIGVKFVTGSTNASLLDEDNARKMLEAGLDELMISIDSVDKAEYEAVRKGLNFDVVSKNIRNFFRIRDEISPDVIIRVRGVAAYDIHAPERRNAMQMWEDFWADIRRPHDRIYIKKLHTWGNEYIQDEQKGNYVQDLTYHPCVVPWGTFHVTTMGLVPLCGQDVDAKHNHGDINKQSIAEVWNGEGFNRIRNLHATGKRNEINNCVRCRLFDPEFSMEKDNDKVGYFAM